MNIIIIASHRMRKRKKPHEETADDTAIVSNEQTRIDVSQRRQIDTSKDIISLFNISVDHHTAIYLACLVRRKRKRKRSMSSSLGAVQCDETIS
jgi:hypothetical protein